MNRYLLVILFLQLCDYFASAFNTEIFNLDDRSRLVPNRESDINFGFSTSAFDDSNGGMSVLVGAPNAKDRSLNAKGDLYKCDVELGETKRCDPIAIDTSYSGGNLDQNWVPTSDNQKLGMSIVSQSGTVVTCAPLWKIRVINPESKAQYPTGRCFVGKMVNNYLDFKEIVPFLKFKKGELKLDYYLTGMDVDISPENDIYYGASGYDYFKGGAFMSDIGLTSVTFFDKGLSNANLMHNITGNNREPDLTNKNMGYSVSAITYNNNKGFVASLPFVNYMKDSEWGYTESEPLVLVVVKIETGWNVLDVLYIPEQTDEWFFSYFGHSIVAADINNDGLDDVIVGAPFYTYDLLDQGAIVVYGLTNPHMQRGNNKEPKGQRKMEFKMYIRGSGRNSRFGSTVASIGDINFDGYNDIAVGAPYEEGDEDAIGAVYIYRGGLNYLSETPDQVIRGYSPSFGFSIAAEFKSGSHYNQIIIGTPEKDEVSVLASRQLISVDFTIKTDGDFTFDDVCGNKQCKDVNFCASYEFVGKKLDTFDSIPNLTVDVSTKNNDDTLQLSFEATTDEQLQFINTNVGIDCMTLKIYTPTIYQSPKVFTIKATVLDLEQNNAIISKVNSKSNEVVTEEIRLSPNCRNDVCKSDIRLTFTRLEDYILGKDDFKIMVTVANKGGDPFILPNLQIATNDELQMFYVEGDSRITCDYVSVLCNLGPSILPNSPEMVFNLTFKPTTEFWTNLKTFSGPFLIKGNVEPLNNTEHISTASANINIVIKVESNFQIKHADSSSFETSYNPYDYEYPEAGLSLDDIGPQISHNYIITNPNDFPVYSSNVVLYIPNKLKVTGMYSFLYSDSFYFMYLEDSVMFSNDEGSPSNDIGSCSYSGGTVDEFKLNDNPVVPIDAPSSEENVVLPDDYKEIFSDIVFDNAKWTKFDCNINEIKTKKKINIAIKFRFIYNVIKTSRETKINKLKTLAVAKITNLPLGAAFDGESKAQVETIIVIKENDVSGLFWFEILFIIVISLLISCIVALVAWKCGLLTRKKQIDHENEAKEDIELEDGSEKQPLNQ